MFGDCFLRGLRPSGRNKLANTKFTRTIVQISKSGQTTTRGKKEHTHMRGPHSVPPFHLLIFLPGFLT